MRNKRTKKHAVTNSPTTDANVTGRRRFLAAAAAVTAGGAFAACSKKDDAAKKAGAPAVQSGSVVALKFQSTWPTKDIFHEYAQDYAEKVNAMSGGRLKLDVLPAGAVVGALQMQDAVNSGILDGGHGVTAYWYGKHKAFSLFGTGPSFGMDANMLLGWVKYGGGAALYNEMLRDVLKLNVVGFLTGPMPTQPLGWFKKEVKSPEDLKNLKYRTVGLSADLFKEMGSAVTIMGGGDIVPAMDRGLLDAAEFNNPSSDRLLGFPDVSKVYMLQSYHQPLECFEIIFNKTRYDALASEQKEILKYAAEAASADMAWKAMDRYSTDLAEIKKQGVKVYRTPKPVLAAQLKAWDAVIKKNMEDPFFAKVIASQRAWAERVVAFNVDVTVDPTMAYDHFFAKKG